MSVTPVSCMALQGTVSMKFIYIWHKPNAINTVLSWRRCIQSHRDTSSINIRVMIEPTTVYAARS